MTGRQISEFPELADENRLIWDKNAHWWDDQIGDGNDFQTVLIDPATERLLEVTNGNVILDIACGAGRFARRMAELGAKVIAFDYSERFIARARERTSIEATIEYRVLDAADKSALLSLGMNRFDKAVCTMALMDMPVVDPLFAALRRMLKPGGTFVFSITHPCFNSGTVTLFAEQCDDEDGRQRTRTGVKVSSYLLPVASKGEGVTGQPQPQWYFHRPLHLLFQSGFAHGFVVDGIEEPGLPHPEKPKATARWRDTPAIPPVMVVRMRLS